jgi:octaprenyl-diphosphate synthase
MSTLDNRLTWKDIVALVEPFLDQVANRLAEQVQTFEPCIRTYAEYALTNQGKQLRPALVALSSGAEGGFSDELVTVAVIIEMVHLATLVHDDVMDGAELRRGRPSLAVNWGNEIAVLLGDCLLAHAVQMAASFDTPEICRAVAATTNRVCSGEILQNQNRTNFELNRAEYFRMLEMKTGSLFGLSCDLGAAISGGKESRRSVLRKFGLAFGTAYQLYDDCVDLFGSEAVVGKSLGTDLAGGKLTLPILVVLERASDSERAQVKELVTHWDGSSWGPLRALLDRYEAWAESRRTVHYYLAGAQEQIKSLVESQRHTALMHLTRFVAQLTDGLRAPA